MKILWLCNQMLPDVAEALGKKPSCKEGWLTGILSSVKKGHDFQLSVAFPMSIDDYQGTIDGINYYGFCEDTAHPETYDEHSEISLKKIIDNVNPDVIHIFGTEYPHTLAMCRAASNTPDKILVGIQGIMDICKDHYFDGLPKDIINKATFRDRLKKDSLLEQQHKFALRAVNELKALEITGNVTGRTDFDRNFTKEKAKNAKYFFLNESLRPEFYEGTWNINDIRRHSIFLSQGNYPIKGLHVMLKAASLLKEKYPDLHIAVAGDRITRQESLKDKIKISEYGKYLLKLIKDLKLEDVIEFTGPLDAYAVKERLLKSHVFVSASTIENSPNSLGEAMLLRTPSVSSRVGGVPSIFNEGEDGLLFENCNASELAECIEEIFESDALALTFSKNAYEHAHVTHDRVANYKRLIEIYTKIASKE